MDGRTVLARRAQSYMPGSEGVVNAPLKDLSFLVEKSPEELAQYAGEYVIRAGSSFDARVEAGELVFGSYLLLPIGEDLFFSIQDYSEVEIVRGDDGTILHADWNGTIMRKQR